MEDPWSSVHIVIKTFPGNDFITAPMEHQERNEPAHNTGYVTAPHHNYLGYYYGRYTDNHLMTISDKLKSRSVNDDMDANKISDGEKEKVRLIIITENR